MTSVAVTAARETTVAIATGKKRDRSPRSLAFLIALWFSLFFGVVVLLVLIVSTAIDGASRFDSRPVHQLPVVTRARDERLPRRHPRLDVADARHGPARRTAGHRLGALPRGVRRP